MKQVSNARLLAALVIMLLAFLLISASLSVRQQREMLHEEVERDARIRLDLMANASLEALLKSDYAAVRNFIEQWGMQHKEYQEIHVIAPNGFAIAKYINHEPPEGTTYYLIKELTIGDAKLATLYLRGDYREVERVLIQLKAELVISAFLITTLLGAALWALFRNLAIAPLEAEVSKRTQALLDINQELELLTNNSPS